MSESLLSGHQDLRGKQKPSDCREIVFRFTFSFYFEIIRKTVQRYTHAHVLPHRYESDAFLIIRSSFFVSSPLLYSSIHYPSVCFETTVLHS